MSLRLMAHLWDHAPYRDATLLLLLALADASDDTGEGCAALPALAHLCRLSLEHTGAQLAQLEADGWLHLLAAGEPPGEPHYCLCLERLPRRAGR